MLHKQILWYFTNNLFFFPHLCFKEKKQKQKSSPHTSSFYAIIDILENNL